MRAHVDSNSVTLSERDLEVFMGWWPSSGLEGLRGVTFFYGRLGELEDVVYRNGLAERWDGAAIAALCDDAADYLGCVDSSQYRAAAREHARKLGRFPWWWPDRFGR